jgi:hypothetical protein
VIDVDAFGAARHRNAHEAANDELKAASGQLRYSNDEPSDSNIRLKRNIADLDMLLKNAASHRGHGDRITRHRCDQCLKKDAPITGY